MVFGCPSRQDYVYYNDLVNSMSCIISHVMGVNLVELERHLVEETWPMPRKGMERMCFAMGLPCIPIDKISANASSKLWLESPWKTTFERLAAATFLVGGGEVLIPGLYFLSSKILGTNGRYDLEVGFPGLASRYVYTKVQTMVEGADTMRERWQATSLVAGKNGRMDDRIEPRLKKLRRTSLDETPQSLGVLNSQIALIGLRGYPEDERSCTEVLCQLAECNMDLTTPFEGLQMLRIYRQIMRDYNPKPAIVSPLSATDSKETLHFLRLYADLVYLTHANWWVDVNLLFNSFPRRLMARGVR